MARAGVNNPIVATKVLIRGRNLWTYAVACHTVCVVRLVHHASGAPRTNDVTARLCEDENGRFFLIFTTDDLVFQNCNTEHAVGLQARWYFCVKAVGYLLLHLP